MKNFKPHIQESKPKVYALLFKGGVGESEANMIIMVDVGYSLEEATKRAKHAMVHQLVQSTGANNDDKVKKIKKIVSGMKVSLHHSSDLETMCKNFGTVTENIDEHSLFMKEIIEKKDKTLFNKTKHLFSETQVAYLKERLKTNK